MNCKKSGTGIALGKHEKEFRARGNKHERRRLNLSATLKILSPRRQGEASSVLYQQKFLRAHQGSNPKSHPSGCLYFRDFESLSPVNKSKKKKKVVINRQ